MWFVYILQNTTNKKFYIGCTSNLEERIWQHQVKRKKRWSGRQKGQWQLVYQEDFETKREALLREKEIKRKKSRIYIKELINKNNTSIAVHK